MKLLELYEAILETAKMAVNEEGMVTQVTNFDPERQKETEPVIIDGKRLVMPNQYHIDRPDKDAKIMFHPLAEDAIAGESAVFRKLKRSCMVKINKTVFDLICMMMTLGLNISEHKKLNPDQARILSTLKNVDQRSEKDLVKMLVNAVKNEGIESTFVKVFFRKGGKIGTKKYSRAGIVTFPFHKELGEEKDEYYGVKLRKKDLHVFDKLIEHIFPSITDEQGYDQGSDSEVAPYLEALIQTVAGLGVDINKCVDMYADFLPAPEMLKIQMRWQKAVKDLESYLPQIRRIPVQAQYGNRGDEKVEDTMKAMAEVQDSAKNALTTDQKVREAPTAQVNNTAPWEGVGTAPPTPTMSTAQLVNTPALYTPPPVQQPYMPAHSPAPSMGNHAGTGRISASELLGVTTNPSGMMPGTNMQMSPTWGYQQGGTSTPGPLNRGIFF